MAISIASSAYVRMLSRTKVTYMDSLEKAMSFWRHEALIAQNTMMAKIYNGVASVLWSLRPIRNYPLGATTEAVMCPLDCPRG